MVYEHQQISKLETYIHKIMKTENKLETTAVFNANSMCKAHPDM